MSSCFDLEMDFAAGVYLSEAQNPTLHTVYVYTVYVLIHTGKGRGMNIEQERREEGQQERVQIT
jgi:hypothetical protein